MFTRKMKLIKQIIVLLEVENIKKVNKTKFDRYKLTYDVQIKYVVKIKHVVKLK